MKRAAFFYSLLLLFQACGPPEKKAELPADLIPKEKMIELVADYHMAEAQATLALQADTTGKLNTDKYFDEVYKNHAVTKKQYRSSLSYYGQNVSDMNEIYEKAIIDLSRKQAAVKK